MRPSLDGSFKSGRGPSRAALDRRSTRPAQVNGGRPLLSRRYFRSRAKVFCSFFVPKYAFCLSVRWRWGALDSAWLAAFCPGLLAAPRPPPPLPTFFLQSRLASSSAHDRG